MDESPALGATFLSQRPAPRPEDPDALDAALAEALAAARAAWPGVDLPSADFARALATRCAPDQPPLAALASLHVADVYLAAACASGDPAALAAFDRAFISTTPLLLAKVSTNPEFIAEAQQLLRRRLMVGEGGPPRVATYAGTGPLAGWFRATAMRLALNLRRAERVRPLEVELSESLTPHANHLESELLRSRHQAEFQSALRNALAGLDPEEKLLLRWHFLEALPLGRIAELQGVSKSTVSRWVSAARDKVLAATRAELKLRLDVQSHELSTLVRVLFEDAGGALTALLSQAER